MKNLKIDPTGAAKLVVLLLVYINQILASFGKSPIPISNDDLNIFVSSGITIAYSLYGYFTKPQLTKSTPNKANVTSTNTSQAPKKGANPSEDAK